MQWLALALVTALAPTAAQAQYPNKPVRLVLPYSPGGIVDYVGRTLATHMSGPLGQQVVAENRPGAGGTAGTDTVARRARWLFHRDHGSGDRDQSDAAAEHAP